MRLALKGYDYGILVEKGAYRALTPPLTSGVDKAFILADESLPQEAFQELENHLSLPSHIMKLPGGEDVKRLDIAESIWNELLQSGAHRNTLFISFGGGTIGDLGGFCASTFMRGIPYLLCPTTLLAMADSSIGSKTGINFASTKNIIGTFYAPRAVLIDLDQLHTLPEPLFWQGMAEIIKIAFITNATLLKVIEETLDTLPADEEALEHILIEAIKSKIKIIEQDAREAHLRAILNWGHTFGHAIEAVSSDYSHGEAISIGMNLAAKLSHKLHLLDSQTVDRQRLLLERAHLPTQLPSSLPPQKLLEAMHRDKKATGEKLAFVLLRGVASPEIHR